VPGADIVDGDAHTKPLQRRDALTCRCEILDRIALGDFQHHLRKLDRRAGEDVAHLLHDRWFAEELAGKIERDPQIRPAADGRTGFYAYFLHKAARELVNEAAGFHQRDKCAR